MLFQGFDGISEISFDRDGEIYKSLIALLKEKSPKFAEFINRDEFKKSKVSRTEQSITQLHDQRDLHHRDEAHEEHEGRQEHADQGEITKKKKKVAAGEQKKRMEPSLRWKVLGTTAGDADESKTE